MKKHTFTIAAVIGFMMPTILFGFHVYSANPDEPMTSDIVRVRYTVLEEVSKRYRAFWTGQRGNISFELIELTNLDTEESLYGVEVNIETERQERASSSIAFSSIGSYWGVSSSVTYQNLQKSGYVFLDEMDLKEVIDFLNGIIGEAGKAQRNFVLYSISIRQHFEFGMMYDPGSLSENKWSFIFTADGATHSLDYRDGISVLQSLYKFRSHMLDIQP